MKLTLNSDRIEINIEDKEAVTESDFADMILSLIEASGFSTKGMMETLSEATEEYLELHYPKEQ
jgi:hypothetical protein